MRTLTIVAVLLLLVGCGSTVNNNMYFESDFMDSNPGVGTEAIAADAPEEGEEIAATERGGPEEAPGATETGRVSAPISGQTGTGYQILVFSQAGTTAQDVAAQVDAAVRARIAANSPNADLGGNETPEEPTPDGP